MHICYAMLSGSVTSYSLRPHGLQLTRLLCPWTSPGKSIRMGCHALLQGIFPTLISNPGLPHYRWILYHLSHQGGFVNLLDAHLLVLTDSYFRTFSSYVSVLLPVLYLFFLNELSHSLPPAGPVLSSSYVASSIQKTLL